MGRVWVERGLLVTVVVLAGCTSHRPVPFHPPHARPLAPADVPLVPTRVPAGVVLSPADPTPMRPPKQVLALSGGGVFGAFSAGYLSGWTLSGTRPEFDVVTGISTGALIAPFAFLGPDFDHRAKHLYTTIGAADLFEPRSWVAIPFKDAAASSDPLKKLIETELTPQLVERLAAEHRKGRRLYVGTTNLDTRRLVVWDIGAVACRGCPDACGLIRDIVLASASVPGMFPPVKIDVEVDGKQYHELHVDGAVSAPLFVPADVFAAAAAGAVRVVVPPGAVTPGPAVAPAGNLYLIVAGKLYPDAGPVRRKTFPVLGASTTALLYAHCRAELANLYSLAHQSGLRYHLAAVPAPFETVNDGVQFDKKEMARLFEEGLKVGAAGQWMNGPPALTPGDGDFIRTGTQLRTPEGLVPGQ